MPSQKLLFVANRAEFFFSHRLPVAHAAQERGLEVHVATPKDPYVPDLKAHELIWHELELEGKSLNPIQEFRTLLHLIQLYRAVRPELVHHIAFKGILYGSIAARIARVPRVVNSFTGLGHLFSADTPKIRLVRWIALQASRFGFGHPQSRTIFQNPDNIDEFVERGVLSQNQVRLIKGSGVDVSTFEPASQPGGTPIVILASRLVWDKGVGEFVEAARLLKQKGTDARFALVGKSDPLNPNAVPEDQLKAWDEEGPVEWWGFQENMPSIFANTHVVCLPSYYREGVPKVLIEAAACERPIVTTDMPGCREIVHDGKNGLLVPPKDSKSLAGALKEVISNPEKRTEMGAYGRRLVKDEFSLERVVQDTMDVYDELLEFSEIKKGA
ncbi:glycosyltransferase family 4 protein [Salinibacter altiplanensis]|uniref:glycosyltransferase family 4 protein n=1 Tax=Salinibacter altiplanensis TaxID=1803181 RepID=UPI000C9EE8CF|nr:glycosyltransferase family 4 protein [Salinibacter altiplanensis]